MTSNACHTNNLADILEGLFLAKKVNINYSHSFLPKFTLQNNVFDSQNKSVHSGVPNHPQSGVSTMPESYLSTFYPFCCTQYPPERPPSFPHLGSLRVQPLILWSCCSLWCSPWVADCWWVHATQNIIKFKRGCFVYSHNKTIVTSLLHWIKNYVLEFGFFYLVFFSFLLNR